MISAIPRIWGLGTRMSDACVYVVFSAPIRLSIVIQHVAEASSAQVQHQNPVGAIVATPSPELSPCLQLADLPAPRNSL